MYKLFMIAVGSGYTAYVIYYCKMYLVLSMIIDFVVWGMRKLKCQHSTFLSMQRLIRLAVTKPRAQDPERQEGREKKEKVRL